MSPNASRTADELAGPPIPSRTVLALVSSMTTRDRNMKRPSRLRIVSSIVAGSRSSKCSGPVRLSTKLTSMRPFGEHHAPNCHAPGASASTSLVSWPCRNWAASGPFTERVESGPRSQTTALSRAASSSAVRSPKLKTVSASVFAPRATRNSVQELMPALFASAELLTAPGRWMC